ncbi:Chemotaxis protein methyltransferase CheR [hydrothermal vent metagenome]|uniref:protein-glutamate O-methyltransferase n=1 Tax=hydrothermal vent metagenome TaxID=652676 RepID=A0A3B0YGQ9_9ZZZZ
MLQVTITDSEFELFRDFIFQQAGISLSDEKKTLVSSRLNKRLRHFSLASFSEYFTLIMDSSHLDERQMMIDLLTTNETYFFREPKHFEYLKEEVLDQWQGGAFRVWSAASSSGEEAYSIAMLLDDVLGVKYPWEVLGSDISSRVLKKARQGHYLQERIEGIPKPYLRKYCLKGTGEHQGTLLIDKKLRSKVKFEHVNLKESLGHLGGFDIIFLRNVMIYFNKETKQEVIKQIMKEMHTNSLLIIGHSESLKGINDDLVSVFPTVYKKTGSS